MFEDINAVYENGYFRPLSPINLNEKETVRIVILPEKTLSGTDEIVKILIKADLMRQPVLMKTSAFPDPVSEKERHELAEKLGKIPATPISEIVISERGQQ